MSSNRSSDFVTDKIELDETMEAVANILEKSHPNLNGVLVIQNLFNLRNSESEEAILTYRKLFDKDDAKSLDNYFNLCVKQEYRDVLHTQMSNNYIETFPWVWLAWTVDNGNHLNARRRMLLKNISQDTLHVSIC